MEWFSDTQWMGYADETGITPTFPDSITGILTGAKYNSESGIIVGFPLKIAFPALTTLAQPLPGL